MNHALFKFLDVNRLNMFAINKIRNIRALLVAYYATFVNAIDQSQAQISTEWSERRVSLCMYVCI